MSDIVNAFFHKHYPPNLDPLKFEPDWCGGGVEQRYTDSSRSTIFPYMVCADGFQMSVQGHFGAYSYPRSDFADRYMQVEVMLENEHMNEPLFGEEGNGGDGWKVFGYVPIETVVAVIDKHGGLVEIAS